MDEKLLLEDLAEAVAIKSVYSEPKPDAPYGEGCREALEWFVKKARAYGLAAENIDNRCAYAEVGSGKECIGVLAHLDVVPAGNGWATDPFTMVEENGKVYGRGVGDDKGSVVVCLHALKELKDSGAKLKKRVRLIVGADEERGSSCIKHYVAAGCEIPSASFVPDSEFPVINSEKGIAHIRLDFADPALASDLVSVSGAECMNAVPDRASVRIKKDGALYKAFEEVCGGSVTSDLFASAPAANAIISAGASPKDFEIAVLRDCVEIVANGTAEHASTPDKGDNALWKAFAFLSAFNGVILSDALPLIVEKLCAKDAMTRIGVYVNDKKSGDLTACMSQARVDGDTLSVVIDFRLPLGVTPESVCAALDEHTGCKAVVLDYHENLYIDEASPLIKTLLKVYRGITGDMTPPLQTGGGTYARELPNAVAFGCTPLDLDINMHRADENFPIAQLFKNYDIYLAAMKELAK